MNPQHVTLGKLKNTGVDRGLVRGFVVGYADRNGLDYETAHRRLLEGAKGMLNPLPKFVTQRMPPATNPDDLDGAGDRPGDEDAQRERSMRGTG